VCLSIYLYLQTFELIIMERIGIFYGTTLGNSRKIAHLIQKAFPSGTADVRDILNSNITDIELYDNLIFGTSTWSLGDMQDDWENFISQLTKISWIKKKVALFGVGDQKAWPDSFVNGLGALYHKLPDKTCVVGMTSTDGYQFDISLAIKNNQFVGLVIDNNNQPELTLPRIQAWVDQLQKEFI